MPQQPGLAQNALAHLLVNPVQITSLCHCSSATSAGGKDKRGEGKGGMCTTKGYAMSNLMTTKDSMSVSALAEL